MALVSAGEKKIPSAPDLRQLPTFAKISEART
jgi:hypothetical protein